MIRWIKIVRKRVNKINVEKGSPAELHVLSVELIAAEVVVVKGYKRMKFKERFMIIDGDGIRNSNAWEKYCLFESIC